MKVFSKYLVMASRSDAAPRVAASFNTKKEASEALTKAFGECTGARHTARSIRKSYGGKNGNRRARTYRR